MEKYVGMSKPCFLGFDIPTCCVHQCNVINQTTKRYSPYKSPSPPPPPYLLTHVCGLFN